MEKKEVPTPAEDNRIPIEGRSMFHTKQRIEFLEAEVREIQDKFTIEARVQEVEQLVKMLLEAHKNLLDNFRELIQVVAEPQEE